MQQLLKLYAAWSGESPAHVERLPKAGSNRKYVRLFGADGRSVIGVDGPDPSENRCFIYLSRHFADRGLPVPQILAVDASTSCYLQTDLGTLSLYQALSAGRSRGGAYDETERALIRRVIRRLPHVQVTGAEALNAGYLLSPSRFDARAAMFDLNYFKYCFLRTTPVNYDELRLEEDMRRLADDLADDPCDTFLYRDFQARNVMLYTPPGSAEAPQPYFIDYQGGQLGPLQYDVASYLWQASARYPQSLREEMIGAYLDELATLRPVDRAAFLRRLHLFVFFRTLQVLGTYGLRGYFEHKKYFLDSIPLAIRNLRQELADGTAAPYPYFADLLRQLVDLPQFATPAAAPAAADGTAPAGGPLVVRVFSFSYKKGIPADESGYGGGYVFDCRSTNNPGRYAQYRDLTGLDEPVVRFLETDGEILAFLDNVFQLAEHHVARYLERGFTDLMFCFGCTGGRHRSVYAAQHLAEHLHRKFGIEVRLCHREQGLSTVFPARRPD